MLLLVDASTKVELCTEKLDSRYPLLAIRLSNELHLSDVVSGLLRLLPPLLLPQQSVLSPNGIKLQESMALVFVDTNINST